MRDNFYEDPEGQVPKDEIYDLYAVFSKEKGWTPKRKSDFGKIVKKAFPFVSSRRLGSAGKQVAHYSGIAPCNGLNRGRGGVVAEAKRSPPKDRKSVV